MSKQNALCFFLPAMLLIFSSSDSLISPPDYQALYQHFHRYVDEEVLAGTVIFIEKDGILSKDIYGYQNREEAKPMTEQSIFRLASMTKPIIAAAILQLVERKLIHLTDPVSKYIPEVGNMSVYDGSELGVKQDGQMTIRHLLTHTSGITSGLDLTDAGVAAHQHISQQPINDLASLIKAICGTQLAFQPGEGWAYGYSNDLLAYIIERVTQLSIEQYLVNNILQPLEMVQTRFQVLDNEKLTTVYATQTVGGLEPIEPPANSKYTNGENFGRGNGGLVSTAGDYLNFCRMLLQQGQFKGKQILQPSSIALLSKNAIPEAYLHYQVAGNEMIGQGYGLGVGVVRGNSPFGAKGDFYWPGALYTYFFVSPENNTIGIFMTQLHDRNRMGMLWEFHQLVTSSIH